MSDRILVIGASGHLGSRLARRATSAGWAVAGTYFHAATPAAGEQLDIRDLSAVHALVQRVRPHVVVNAAAGRDDWRLMADGAAHVALAAVEFGARLVHVSTDALFSGRAVHYDESALPDPVYRYGAAKAAAETAVAAIDPGATIARTSLILGDGRGQHERHARELATGRIQGALFTDMVRRPVHVEDLADALLELAASDYSGVLNVAGADVVNRYDLGLLIAEREGLDPSRLSAATIAATGAHLPTDVRLDTARAVALLRTRLRGVHEFMRR